MGSYPEEIDFISLFNAEPKVQDTSSPFYYNQSTFAFRNEQEAFVVKISPAMNEFELKVEQLASGKLITYHSFKTVGKLEILSDKKDSAEILIILDQDRDRFLASVEITFRPVFCMVFREQFS